MELEDQFYKAFNAELEMWMELQQRKQITTDDVRYVFLKTCATFPQQFEQR